MEQPLYKIRGTKVTSPYPVQLTPAETRLIFSLQRYFDPTNIFADYYAPKVNSSTRRSSDMTNFTISATTKTLTGSEYIQIDCLAINEQGIFVFESKDYSGWIFGNGADREWTQVLDFGREKHRFYNPVKQNTTHLTAIADFLPPDLPIHSIIVFGNNSELKSISSLPDSCYVCTQANLRSTLNAVCIAKPLSAITITEIHQRLSTHRVAPNTITRHEHVSDIQSSLPQN